MEAIKEYLYLYNEIFDSETRKELNELPEISNFDRQLIENQLMRKISKDEIETINNILSTISEVSK